MYVLILCIIVTIENKIKKINNDSKLLLYDTGNSENELTENILLYTYSKFMEIIGAMDTLVYK